MLLGFVTTAVSRVSFDEGLITLVNDSVITLQVKLQVQESVEDIPHF
jgi:hypothetical protein